MRTYKAAIIWSTLSILSSVTALTTPQVGQEAAQVPLAASAQPHYAVTELHGPPLKDTAFRIGYTAINNHGDLVGTLTKKGERPSFILCEDRLTVISGPPGTSCFANGLNDRRQVFGTLYKDAEGAISDAFVWEEGVLTVLPSLEGKRASAYSANDKGQIVGMALNSVGETRPVLWEKGKARDLGTPNGRPASAIGINESGWIVGIMDVGEGYSRAVLWENGRTRDLGLIEGYSYSGARAISDAGIVTGSVSWSGSHLRAPSGIHTFLWRDGSMKDLGTTGGGRSHPLAINRMGEIVGVSRTADQKQCGYVYRNERMVALNDLLSQKDRDAWDVYFARGINDRGWILGSAYRRGSRDTVDVILRPSR
jgi:probable HAF family extracellular repeat protein